MIIQILNRNSGGLTDKLQGCWHEERCAWITTLSPFKNCNLKTFTLEQAEIFKSENLPYRPIYETPHIHSLCVKNVKTYIQKITHHFYKAVL